MSYPFVSNLFVNKIKYLNRFIIQIDQVIVKKNHNFSNIVEPILYVIGGSLEKIHYSFQT